MTDRNYLIGDAITLAFFAGVSFVCFLIVLGVGLGPWFESGILIPGSFIPLVVSYTFFRMSMHVAEGIKNEHN